MILIRVNIYAVDYFIPGSQCHRDVVEQFTLLNEFLLVYYLGINVEKSHNDMVFIVSRAHYVEPDILYLISELLSVCQTYRSALGKIAHERIFIKLSDNIVNIVFVDELLYIFYHISKEILTDLGRSEL